MESLELIPTLEVSDRILLIITTMTPRFITLEEHFISANVLAAHDAPKNTSAASIGQKIFPEAIKRLPDLGPLRIQSMDSNNIQTQVVSHVPMGAALTPQRTYAINNQLAEACKEHPGRLAGFATLPMGTPSAIADELARCVRELGFVGALVGNHADGSFYDDTRYNGFWAAAESLDVPVYLHPSDPSTDMKATLYNSPSISAVDSHILGTFAYGWHAEVATHVLRLFAAGVFDMFPRLKLIIGHFGSSLPMYVDRVAWSEGLGAFQERERAFKTVYAENIWITTSGCWSVDPLAMILRNTDIEHVLFSVDYPFTRNEDGARFMEALRASGLVNEEQFEMIACENARKLLRL